MDKPLEEFEPLFDYSRVQPADFVCIDDDDDDDDLDSCPIFVAGKRKRKPDDPTGKEAEKALINLDDDVEDKRLKDEEDWLPPPPKISNTGSRFQEDKTLQALRLKKQELASVAQSAEEMLKSVIESAKREFNNTAKPDMDAKPPERQVERQKILISIQDKDGQKQFRMYKDDKFERLFKMYADKVNLGVDRLVFSFDGDKVGPNATPGGLGLEDYDMLEVHVKSQ